MIGQVQGVINFVATSTPKPASPSSFLLTEKLLLIEPIAVHAVSL